MKLTISTADGRVATIEVAASETIETVKVLVEVELGVLLLKQQLFHNGHELSNTATLEGSSVVDGDLLLVREIPDSASTGTAATPAPAAAAAESAPAATAGGPGAPTAAPLLPPGAMQALSMLPLPAVGPAVDKDEPVPVGITWSDVPGGIDPDRLHKIVRANPPMMRSVEYSDPVMAAAFADADPTTLRTLMMKRELEKFQARRAEALEAQRLNDNPYDADAQSKIAETIRQRNVEQNRLLAMEHVPEAFSSVVMLYVNCEVNNVPLKAFVDSGAQSTIMSVKCAERCGLMRLVDRRFAGQAVGVGTARIVGKVHLASLKIGGVYLNCSFTVLDQNDMDFLFGLDMLKRHQCIIDLKDRKLQLEGPSGPVRVPFLSEGEVRGHTDTRFLPRHSPKARAPPAAAAPAPAPASAASAAPAPTSATTPSASAASGAGGAAPPPPPPAGAVPDLFASLPATLFDASALASLGAGSGGAGGDGDGDVDMGAGAGASTTPAAPPVPAAGTATAAPSGATATAAAAPSGAATAGEDGKIARLMALGFGRSDVVDALRLAGGSEEVAQTVLLQSAVSQ